jgi:hypothetical protein
MGMPHDPMIAPSASPDSLRFWKVGLALLFGFFGAGAPDCGSGVSGFSRQPSGRSIGAIIGSCIEGNRRAWGSLMNSVDDGFE